jgi:hypothetical protein
VNIAIAYGAIWIVTIRDGVYVSVELDTAVGIDPPFTSLQELI